jgi:phenylpyruvate tautomerase PptA (4-oxalocrotonate tautomerase family)
MPYLQLDVSSYCSIEDKKRLAGKLCETYSSIMSVDIRRISIAIRELGDGGLWRTIDGELKPTAVLMHRGTRLERRLFECGVHPTRG